MKVGFYSKNDINKEIINSAQFTTLTEAVEFFAKTKALPVEVFLELFIVVPINRIMHE